MQRYNAGRYQFSAQFIAGDCCNPTLKEEFVALDFFDVVSCQFAIHYSFETIERAREFVRNAASKLRPGGYFFGTTVDMNVLVQRIGMSEDGRRCGNSQYDVVFDEFGPEGPTNSSRYVFSLVDAVTNVPEYLIDPRVLIQLCEEEGLEVVRMQNFYSMYEEEMESRRFHRLTDRSNIPSSANKFDPDTWETLGLYMAFVFRKKGQAETLRHNKPKSRNGTELRATRVNPTSIIILDDKP